MLASKKFSLGLPDCSHHVSLVILF
uniref:Uncharacterized protein n=1 Tax=Musa acuminata subsp. malaccensis TaxID=214687 RepID=A0A804HSI5_MUSAM